MNPISEISPIIQQQKIFTSNNFDSINNAVELFSSGLSNSLWSRCTHSTVVSRSPLIPLKIELHFSTYQGFASKSFAAKLLLGWPNDHRDSYNIVDIVWKPVPMKSELLRKIWFTFSFKYVSKKNFSIWSQIARSHDSTVFSAIFHNYLKIA